MHTATNILDALVNLSERAKWDRGCGDPAGALDNIRRWAQWRFGLPSLEALLAGHLAELERGRQGFFGDPSPSAPSAKAGETGPMDA